ncbi:two-component sensor histidine kinase [Embleya hyalina]|uniref:Two-component sensor histidine kinase n=2 Tax=Embleya hyalina TaxID=516124 RepID=A0A401Z1W1_9ACTN|nr:two-component sensor histidine kinase [Embleya hyalina]
MYGGMSLVAGTVLSGIVYWFVDQRLSQQLPTATAGTFAADTSDAHDRTEHLTGRSRPVLPLPGAAGRLTVIPADSIRRAVDTGRNVTMTHLPTVLVATPLLLAATSIPAGRWMSGRVPRRVLRITATARRSSEHNPHEPIALPGPDDELKELADTFDGKPDRPE